MDFIKPYERRLNTELNKFPQLNQLERYTGVSKTYLVVGVAAAYLLMVYLNIGGIGQFFANTASVVVPGYFSLIALETPGKADDTQFLTYWVVFAAFSIFETWSSVITHWIPAYWLFKTLLFLWLGLPAFGGARYVYATLLQPISRNFLGIKASPISSLKDDIPSATY